METQQETYQVAPTRDLSSSSSAFVSACQSPFFSPRSPQFRKTESVITHKSIATAISDDRVRSRSFGLLESSVNVDFLASDVCQERNFSPPGDFETPKAVTEEDGGLLFSQNGDRYGNSSHPKPRGRQKTARSSRKYSSVQNSATRIKSCDVYIGFHGCKPSLLRFTNWLRSELELQGISCFASDRAQCRSSRSRRMVESVMKATPFGVMILTKKSFGNPYTIEELRNFLEKKNLLPIFFDLNSCDCLSRDIIEKRGDMWEKNGGELWLLYGGLEKEWREAVDGLSRALLDWQLEAFDGNWRDCILKSVVLLATRLGRRSVVERINRWKERVDKEEFPFHRNEEFVGRKKELSELELILFGSVSSEGEKEYLELKTRQQKQKGSPLGNYAEEGEEEAKDQQQQSEGSSKGKESVLWKESEKEIEMQRLEQSPSHRGRAKCGGGRNGRKRRPPKIIYGRGIACVSGDSGIGKTELVLEYAYRFYQRYKMVLWVGGESRYILQNYLSLRAYLEVDLSSENNSLEKGKVKCFEEQEEEAIGIVRKELMRDIPFLVVIDSLESEKDWWDQRVVMDLLPRFGGETHVIVTTRLPRIMNLEPMKLSYLSGLEALTLMKGGVKDYPISEIDALRIIEEKIGRLTLGLGIVGAILSELPITPSRLLDTINRMPSRDPTWSEREAPVLRRHPFLMQLLDVCLSIFDHADGGGRPRSLATRMVQVCSWFAPAPVPVPLLALAAHKFAGRNRRTRFWKRFLHSLPCCLASSQTKRSEAEAASMLVRFGIARRSTKPEFSLNFHEIIKLYARKRGTTTRSSQAMFQAVCIKGSVSVSSEHLWASCFLLLGFGSDPVIVDAKPPEFVSFVKRVVLPLAAHAFVTLSRRAAALELLRRCTVALEAVADAMLSRAEKWGGRSRLCAPPLSSRDGFATLWRDLALLKATVLETRAKLMIKGGSYDEADDLVRNAIYIRTSIHGDHHPDTISAKETLSRITRLFTNIRLS